MRVGTLQLLAIGFDARSPIPGQLVERVRSLRNSGGARLVDVLCVNRDKLGVLRAEEARTDQLTELRAAPVGSALWQLLGGKGESASARARLELHGVGEIGLDLAFVEHLQYRIEPGASAIFVLTEAKWPAELLDAAVAAGGFPMLCGLLEPETMFIVGYEVARAVEAADHASDLAKENSTSRLNALLEEGSRANDAISALRALVVADLVDPGDLDDAIDTLVAAGLVRERR